MRSWSSQTISAKITRMNLLVSGTALILAYISFLGYDWYSLRHDLVSSLDTEAAIIGANSVSALDFDDPQAAEITLSGLRGSPHVLYAAIIQPDGRSFAEYLRDPDFRPVPGPRLAPGDDESHWNLNGSILLGQRIVFGGKTLGSVYVLAETTDVAHRAERFGLISACILLLSFLIAVLATSAIRNLISRPLTELAQTAQVVSRDRDYSVRAELPSSSDELAFLVRSFNEMLEQIQHRDRMLEQSRTVLEQKVQERTAELTAANRELEAFSYSVAHDLRGPLQNISNIGFLLQQTCAAGDVDGPVLVEKLFDGTSRMSKLIDDLLRLSRATSTPLQRTEVDLSKMVERILKEHETQARNRQVEIVVAPNVYVNADERLLYLAMENLLGNAWKYTSKSASPRIEFGWRKDAQGTVYFVRDTGAGFDPALAGRLFRPFQRLHPESEFPGTGIGLATVQRIIARHGGRIWATAGVDQGAEFSFTLPAETEEPSEAAAI